MLRCRLYSTRYTAIRIKNYLKSTSAIKIATMKNTDDFRFEGKPSHARTKSTPFPVNKDEWDTKEDTGKSMKNALYVLRYAKRHLSGQSNIEPYGNNFATPMNILLEYVNTVFMDFIDIHSTFRIFVCIDT